MHKYFHILLKLSTFLSCVQQTVTVAQIICLLTSINHSFHLDLRHQRSNLSSNTQSIPITMNFWGEVIDAGGSKSAELPDICLLNMSHVLKTKNNFRILTRLFQVAIVGKDGDVCTLVLKLDGTEYHLATLVAGRLPQSQLNVHIPPLSKVQLKAEGAGRNCVR